MLGSSLLVHGMLEPSGSKTQPSLTHSQCCGRHEGQGVALFGSPVNQNKYSILSLYATGYII